jgi:hypothetical protein
MSDKYINTFESVDYAEHFLAEALKLVGLSELVDIDQLRQAITLSKERVEAELTRAGITRSSRRIGRGSVGGVATAGRRTVRQFFRYLGTLDVPLDLAAFFPGERLGSLSALKPADVKIKIDEVLKGFDAEIHAALPDRAKWKQRLEDARQQLADALEGHEGARSDSVRRTASLVTARENFLTTYNGVAKPLIRGLLTALGRKDEMHLFFKDLQVIDTRPPSEDADETPTEESLTPPEATPATTK